MGDIKRRNDMAGQYRQYEIMLRQQRTKATDVPVFWWLKFTRSFLSDSNLSVPHEGMNEREFPFDVFNYDNKALFMVANLKTLAGRYL